MENTTESNNQNNSNAISHTGNQLVINRVFDAPREILWKAWTDPEVTKMWFGPRTFTIPFITIDLRVGGKMINCMHGPDGTDLWSVGEYKEIVPFERIVVTDSFADEHGNIVDASYYGMNPDFPLINDVILTFEDLDGKTNFTMKYEGASPIPEDDLVPMTNGWIESFDKLAEYLAGSK